MKDFAKSIRTVNSIPGSWTKINLMDGPAQEKKYKKYSMIVQHDSDSELGDWWSWYVYNGNTEIASGESKSESEAKTKAEKYIEYNVPMPTGNSQIGNYSVTAETAASTMTREEFDAAIKAFKEELERAKREGRKESVKAYEDALKRAIDLKRKYIGNSKVGNSVPENLHERFGYRLAVTKDGDGKKQTISELEMSISDYKNEIAEKEKELNKDKQNLQKLEAVLRKYK